MKIISKELHRLKNGGLFVILTVEGKRGDLVDLAKEGFSEDPVFFMEAPKSMVNCGNSYTFHLEVKFSSALFGATRKEIFIY